MSVLSLTNVFHKPEEEKTKEKHVPDIRVEGNMVHIKCGKEVMHPSTEKHYIGSITLYAVTEANVALQIGMAQIFPGLGEPVACFKIVNIEQYKSLIAVSYCNLHGLWENTHMLK